MVGLQRICELAGARIPLRTDGDSIKHQQRAADLKFDEAQGRLSRIVDGGAAGVVELIVAQGASHGGRDACTGARLCPRRLIGGLASWILRPHVKPQPLAMDRLLIGLSLWTGERMCFTVCRTVRPAIAQSAQPASMLRVAQKSHG